MRATAIGLREAARRLGYSYSHARHLVIEGTFPVPALQRHGQAHWKFSEADIDRYLQSATADAEPARMTVRGPYRRRLTGVA